jgi:hypothetical protein
MSLPSGWLPNVPAPETVVEPYTGDQTSTWTEPQNPVAFGPQPKSVNNPSGQLQGIPVMGVTAEIAQTLSGPQPS